MWSMFEDELKKINMQLEVDSEPDIPQLFRNIPLDDFGNLLLDIPEQYPNIKAFFPSMASEKVQDSWTGSHGKVLLNMSLAFIQTMITGYSSITGNRIGNATILDFGCGWGRLIRLLYKYVLIGNIYGVDPWDESIKICQKHGVKGHLAISDYVPTSLPFDKEFDLIFSFSVFTHLSEKTTQVALSTLRNYLSPDGLLLITIRPKEFWHHLFKQDAERAAEMTKVHDETGFAFVPQKNRAPLNGDVTFGNTSMSLAYIEKNFPQWKIEAVECNELNKYQVLVFLKPA